MMLDVQKTKNLNTMKQLTIVKCLLLLISCNQMSNSDEGFGGIDVSHQVINIEVHPEEEYFHIHHCM